MDNWIMDNCNEYKALSIIMMSVNATKTGNRRSYHKSRIPYTARLTSFSISFCCFMVSSSWLAPSWQPWPLLLEASSAIFTLVLIILIANNMQGKWKSGGWLDCLNSLTYVTFDLTAGRQTKQTTIAAFKFVEYFWIEQKFYFIYVHSWENRIKAYLHGSLYQNEFSCMPVTSHPTTKLVSTSGKFEIGLTIAERGTIQ